MTLHTAIRILERHNRWRRGAEIPATDPKELGEAIQTIVEHHKSKANDKQTKAQSKQPDKKHS